MAKPAKKDVYSEIALGVSPETAATAAGYTLKDLDASEIERAGAKALAQAEKALLARAEKGVQSAISFILCNRDPKRWKVSSHVKEDGGSFEDEVE